MSKVKKALKYIINFIKETKNNPQKKAIFMLIIMFLFFAFVVVCLRTTNSNINKRNITTEEDNKFEFSLSKIKNDNYHFIHSLNIDNNIEIYEGDKNREKELFSINNLDNYYKYGNIYLKNISGVWSTIDNPCKYEEFKNIDNIEKLLEKASFLSKTEYNDKTSVYNYNISTTSIIKILDNKDIDIDDLPNKIDITADSNDDVIEINYDLSPYFIYKNLGNSSNINIKYSKFGEIKDIEDPK